MSLSKSENRRISRELIEWLETRNIRKSPLVKACLDALLKNPSVEFRCRNCASKLYEKMPGDQAVES